MSASEIEMELLSEGHRLLTDNKIPEAAEVFRRAEKDGSSAAMINLAWIYETGKLQDMDYQEAERYYRKAAEHGSQVAQFYVGSFLYRIRQNYAEAAEFFKRSAEQGYPPAQYRLGTFHKWGLGLEKSVSKAHEFFEKAARRGHIFGRRMVAVRKIKGYNGIQNIPTGIWEFIVMSWAGIKEFLKNPESELLLR